MVVVVVDELVVVDEVVEGVVVDDVGMVVVVTLPALYLSILVMLACAGRSTLEPEGTKDAVMSEPPWT